MNNLLFVGDIHIIEKDIPEIQKIFNEILLTIDRYSISKLILLGDTFDKVKPTPQELDCFSDFVNAIKIPIVLIIANSHESIDKETSYLNHFGIIKNNIITCKEYIDDNYLYCGHFLVKQAKKNIGGTVDKDTLKKYKYVVLGHGHNYELITPNICQLGSIRYVNFRDDPEIPKQILIIQKYRTEEERCKFLSLKSLNPMIDLHLDKNLEIKGYDGMPLPANVSLKGKEKAKIPILEDYLGRITQKTKVRLNFYTLEDYYEWLKIEGFYKDRFVSLKVEKRFLADNTSNIEIAKENINLKDALIEWLDKNKVNSEIKDILIKEIKCSKQ